MSCGSLWWIFGFVRVVIGLYWHLPGFAESILVRKTWRDRGELCGWTWTHDGGLESIHSYDAIVNIIRVVSGHSLNVTRAEQERAVCLA